jgi:dihydrofolate reductase
MRRLRYQVASSLDGFIAGPNGEYDWIVSDPAIDFAALYKEFDTAVMGRKTFELLIADGGSGTMPGLDVVAFSRTLPAREERGVRVTGEDPPTVVAALKAKPGRDIWLFGGGILFRELLDAGLVDTVEIAVMPVMIGSGIPVLPPGASTKLVLGDQKTLSSGIVVLAYSVSGRRGPAPRIAFVRPPKKKSLKAKSKFSRSSATKKAAPSKKTKARPSSRSRKRM